MESKKVKGGAEKEREKKRRKLLEAASQCVKLDRFTVKQPSATQSVPSVEVECVQPGELQPSTGPVAASLLEHSESETPSSSASLLDIYVHPDKPGHSTVHSDIMLSVGSAEPVMGSGEKVKSSAMAVECVGSVEDVEAVCNLFARPRVGERPFFFEKHPIQPFDSSDLPFAAKKVFKRKDGSQRFWVTYDKTSNALYCSVCLAYSKDTESNAFILGMKSWTHVYQRIDEHENSKHHNKCAEAHMYTVMHKDVGELVFSVQKKKHREEVIGNRQVVERVIDVIKLIGKRGLSYRGKTAEAAYTLDDPVLDHGNFLELIILLSKCDPLLKTHLDKVIKSSQKARAAGSKGRGNLVTFLSKTTVNQIIVTVSTLIKQFISNEVQEAGMYSVQLDTTQDISVKDQCSVIIRYVTDQVHERLLSLVSCTDSSGKGFLELFKKVLGENGLDITKCVANATDGAANMQGTYKGFSAWLGKESPNQVHIWCYSHVLNLVIGDATRSPLAAASFFSLLNAVGAFFRESYLRMDILESFMTDKSGNQMRLQTIGQTRWWAKDAALSKIFGSYKNIEKALFVDVILALTNVEESEKFSPELRAKAKAQKEALLKYETIMTAFMYLRIFQITTPLSKYLQTSGLDLLKAQQMVTSSLEQLVVIQRDLANIKLVVDNFITHVKEELVRRLPENITEVQEDFPEKRIRKKKMMPGEQIPDDVITDPLKDFEVCIYNRVLDAAIESLKSRFAKNSAIYRDLACLSPTQFDEVKVHLPADALEKLGDILTQYDEEATKANLQLELVSLAKNWDRLKLTLPEEYCLTRLDEEVDEIEELSSTHRSEVTSDQQQVNCRRCLNCAICVYDTLKRYSLYSLAYKNIGLAYKYLLTLSATQVACERSFSTLKVVKNRLRSTLGATNLEAFMLMAVERDVLMNNVDSETVIDKLASQSSLLRKELFLD